MTKKKKDELKEKLNLKIQDMGFDPRVLRILKSIDEGKKFKTLGDIIKYSHWDLISFKRMGKKAADEVEAVAKRHGFELKRFSESAVRHTNILIPHNPELTKFLIVEELIINLDGKDYKVPLGDIVSVSFKLKNS